MAEYSLQNHIASLSIKPVDLTTLVQKEKEQGVGLYQSFKTGVRLASTPILVSGLIYLSSCGGGAPPGSQSTNVKSPPTQETTQCEGSSKSSSFATNPELYCKGESYSHNYGAAYKIPESMAKEGLHLPNTSNQTPSSNLVIKDFREMEYVLGTIMDLQVDRFLGLIPHTEHDINDVDLALQETVEFVNHWGMICDVLSSNVCGGVNFSNGPIYARAYGRTKKTTQDITQKGINPDGDKVDIIRNGFKINSPESTILRGADVAQWSGNEVWNEPDNRHNIYAANDPLSNIVSHEIGHNKHDKKDNDGNKIQDFHTIESGLSYADRNDGLLLDPEAYRQQILGEVPDYVSGESLLFLESIMNAHFSSRKPFGTNALNTVSSESLENVVELGCGTPP